MHQHLHPKVIAHHSQPTSKIFKAPLNPTRRKQTVSLGDATYKAVFNKRKTGHNVKKTTSARVTADSED